MKPKYNSTLLAAKPENGRHIQGNRIDRRWSALAFGGLLATSIFALSAPSLEAQCKQWNVGHGWRFKQGTLNVDMDLHQEGNVVTGTASFTGTKTKAANGSFGERGLIGGTVDGTVEDDSFAVKIYWENNDIGVYEGTIRPSGRIEGKGWEQRSRRIKVNWYSETTMKCADAAVQPTNPAPPPLKSTGKMPVPTPKPIKSSGKAKTQPSATAPTISANPIAVTIPEGQSHGRTTLTWDAGPDHPDAQVWMKDMQGEERMVVQQGKGTRSVTVELGKNYQIILKDADQELARAAVLTKQ